MKVSSAVDYQKKLNDAVRDFVMTTRQIVQEQMALVAKNSPRSEFNKYLTKCEKKILPMVIDGMTNKEIAWKLNVTERTMKFHVTNILAKHSLRNREELAKYYLLY